MSTRAIARARRALAGVGLVLVAASPAHLEIPRRPTGEIRRD